MYPNEGTTVLPIGWRLNVKRDEHGNATKFKARMYIMGNYSRPGEHYDQTFSPTVRMETFRFMMALAAEHKLYTKHLDATGAYLNCPTNRPLYAKLGDLLLRLFKQIYGLKDSGRAWYKMLDAFVKAIGFTPSEADPCLYIKTTPTAMIMMATWVDDICLISNEQAALDEYDNSRASASTSTARGAG